jgi:hypothetical protein
MSKSTKTARARAEQARLARERVAARGRRLRTAWWSIVAWPALIALFALINVSLPDATGPAGPTGALPPAVAAALNVDPSTLDSVGRGQATGLPQALSDAPALLEGDKPLVLYVGADYCPFCAAQRWALVVALNRFGTFTDLSTSYSARDDVFPGTATLSFHGSTYSSPYLAFDGVEVATSERGADGRYEPLDQLTPEQEAVVQTYNAPPYVSAQSAGAIPFIDFGNQFLMSGSAFSPSLLAGLSHEQIAAALADNPSGALAQALLGSANAFTAVLCQLTGGEPANVCTSPAATAYQQEVTNG